MPQFWNNQLVEQRNRLVQDENVRTLESNDCWRFPFNQKFRKFPGKVSKKSCNEFPNSEPFNRKIPGIQEGVKWKENSCKENFQKFGMPR